MSDGNLTWDGLAKSLSEVEPLPWQDTVVIVDAAFYDEIERGEVPGITVSRPANGLPGSIRVIGQFVFFPLYIDRLGTFKDKQFHILKLERASKFLGVKP